MGTETKKGQRSLDTHTPRSSPHNRSICLGVVAISRKDLMKRAREQNQPFSLIFIIKKGGKKIGKGKIDFFPRDPTIEHVKKSVKSAIERIIEQEV